jgi:hypothetical protein
VSEQERSPQGVLVSSEPYPGEEDSGADFARLADWIAARWIPLTGVLLVAAQTWWMSALVGHSFFWIEDFYMVQRAADDGLTWNYLMWLEGGHLMPIGNLLTWLLTRASLYNWSLFTAATLVLSAIFGLMLLRLLRVLFGDRPGILLLLLVALLSPLAFAGLSWWAVSSTQLPFQIALAGALTSHVYYLRSGSLRSLAATAVWVLVSIAGSDKGLALPFLLFAITSAYLMPGSQRWRRAALDALRRYWTEWTLLGGTLAAGVVVYLVQLHTSSSGFQSARRRLRVHLVPDHHLADPRDAGRTVALVGRGPERLRDGRHSGTPDVARTGRGGRDLPRQPRGAARSVAGLGDPARLDLLR